MNNIKDNEHKNNNGNRDIDDGNNKDKDNKDKFEIDTKDINSIRNKMELKENIDRELWLLYCNTVKKQPTDGNQDKVLM